MSKKKKEAASMEREPDLAKMRPKDPSVESAPRVAGLARRFGC
jgi:hypothetical protein